jgi:hypothetical protein
MRIFKEVGLIFLGMLIMFTILMGISLNNRVNLLEQNISRIINFLNNPPRPAPMGETK